MCLFIIVSCEDNESDNSLTCNDMSRNLKYGSMQLESALTGIYFDGAEHGFLAIKNNNEICSIIIKERYPRVSTVSTSNQNGEEVNQEVPNPEYQGFIEASTENSQSTIEIPPGCTAYIIYPDTFYEDGTEFENPFISGRKQFNRYIEVLGEGDDGYGCVGAGAAKAQDNNGRLWNLF